MQVFSITVDDATAVVIAEAFATTFNYAPPPSGTVINTSTSPDATPSDATPSHATPSDATPSDATPSDATPNMAQKMEDLIFSPATPDITGALGSSIDATPTDPELLAKMEFARQQVIVWVTSIISNYQVQQAVLAAQASTAQLLSTMTIN